MAWVEVEHGKLYYELTEGEGDPVVLVHGSWVDHRTWSLLAPLLAGSMRVLVYDRRAHGQSSGLPRPNPLAEDTDDLAALLRATDHYPAHIVGHSYGGNVALSLANERPEMVRSVVAHEPAALGLLEEDPATQGEASQLRQEVARLTTAIDGGHLEAAAREFVNGFADDPQAWDRLSPDWKQTFLSNAPRWREEFSDPATERPDLRRASESLVPVLFTEGALSPPFLRRMSEAVRGRLKNTRLVRLPGAGHFPHITHPAQYVGVLHRFLVEREVPVA